VSGPQRPARVALVYGFPLTVGGVENHILSLAAALDRSLFEPCVIGTVSEDFRRAAGEADLPIIEWNVPRGHLDLASAYAFGGILRSQRVDLVHHHSPKALLACALVARSLRLPIINTVHLPVRFLVRGRGLRGKVKVRVHEGVDRLLLRRVLARTILVSQQVRDDSVTRRLVRPERAVAIRNGVELERFASRANRSRCRAEHGAQDADVVAIAVGRLDEQKGLDVLLDALARLELAALRLQTWLVGDGPLRAELEQRAAALGLERHVRFLGRRDDVAALLSASDLFVLPSRWEAMPIALLEAMAAGLPCVASEVGDCPALLHEGGHGVLVPPGQAGPLADAIVRLARDPELRAAQGRAARAHAGAFSSERTAAAVAAIYCEVLADHNREGGRE
jgi:glycosyltransferase involved in cell wall biosynthesis